MVLQSGVGLDRSRKKMKIAQDEGQQETVLSHVGKRQLPCAADSCNDPCANAVPYHLTQK